MCGFLPDHRQLAVLVSFSVVGSVGIRYEHIELGERCEQMELKVDLGRLYLDRTLPFLTDHNFAPNLRNVRPLLNDANCLNLWFYFTVS